MAKHPWLYAMSAGVLAGTAALLYWSDLRPPSLLVHEDEIPVQVAQAGKVSTPVIFRLKGELRADNEIDVKARVTGTVSEILYTSGDWVRSGAVIATIRSAEITERVAKAEAAVESARSEVRRREEQLAQAKNQLQKTQEWHDRNLIARADLERAVDAIQTADAEAALARSRVTQQLAILAQSRQLLSLTRVIAPISGVLIRKLVEPGTAVTESVAMFTFTNAETLTVTLRAGIKDLPSISAGMSAKVDAENHRGIAAEGKISGLENRSDEAGVNAEIKIQVSSWNRKFQPGAPVIVAIPSRATDNFVSIPRSAIVERANETYVFKLVNGRAARTEVLLADRQNGTVAVTGLDEGDHVIVEPPASLRPDSLLKISRAAVVKASVD